MRKAIAAALAPLVVAGLLTLGVQVTPEMVLPHIDWILMVAGLIGSYVAARFPSLVAAKKFGDDAK